MRPANNSVFCVCACVCVCVCALVWWQHTRREAGIREGKTRKSEGDEERENFSTSVFADAPISQHSLLSRPLARQHCTPACHHAVTPGTATALRDTQRGSG